MDALGDQSGRRPVEVEITRTGRAPRAEVPVLGANAVATVRPGFRVIASHLLESGEIRTGRGVRRAVTGAVLPLGQEGPRRGAGRGDRVAS